MTICDNAIVAVCSNDRCSGAVRMRLRFVFRRTRRSRFGSSYFSCFAIGRWESFLRDFLRVAQEFGVGDGVCDFREDGRGRVDEGAAAVGEEGEGLADLGVEGGGSRAEGENLLMVTLVEGYFIVNFGGVEGKRGDIRCSRPWLSSASAVNRSVA